MAGLPFIKIFAILFKEAAKPLAGRIKHFSLSHAEARRITIVLGRRYDSFTQSVEFWMRGQMVKELKPITEAHALTVGADLVSQSFLIGVAMALMLFEYYRGSNQKAAESKAKAAEKAERRQLKEARLRAIEDHVAELEVQIGDIRAVLERHYGDELHALARIRSESDAGGGALGMFTRLMPRYWADQLQRRPGGGGEAGGGEGDDAGGAATSPPVQAVPEVSISPASTGGKPSSTATAVASRAAADALDATTRFVESHVCSGASVGDRGQGVCDHPSHGLAAKEVVVDEADGGGQDGSQVSTLLSRVGASLFGVRRAVAQERTAAWKDEKGGDGGMAGQGGAASPALK